MNYNPKVKLFLPKGLSKPTIGMEQAYDFVIKPFDQIPTIYQDLVDIKIKFQFINSFEENPTIAFCMTSKVDYSNVLVLKITPNGYTYNSDPLAIEVSNVGFKPHFSTQNWYHPMIHELGHAIHFSSFKLHHPLVIHKFILEMFCDFLNNFKQEKIMFSDETTFFQLKDDLDVFVSGYSSTSIEEAFAEFFALAYGNSKNSPLAKKSIEKFYSFVTKTKK